MNNTEYNRYEFKMYVGTSNILCFRSYVIDKDNYTILEIPDLGIDETYKNIFLKVLKGELEEKFYNKNDIIDRQLPDPLKIHIDGENGIDNLEAFEQFAPLFGISTNLELANLEETVRFRFAGPSLNAEYGLLYNDANQLESISNTLMKIIERPANNANFGTVLQMPLMTGSTVVPFSTENVDSDALNVIRKVFSDINRGQIDVEYINNEENKFANLYKKFAIELKRLKSIKDLDEFQIKLHGDEEYTTLINMSYLSQVENDIYNNTIVHGNATIAYYKPSLKKNPNISSLVVDYGDIECHLHIDYNSDNYSRFKRIANYPEGTHVYFSGFKDGGDRTILITELRIIESTD